MAALILCGVTAWGVIAPAVEPPAAKKPVPADGKGGAGSQVDMSAIPADEKAEKADLKKLGEGFKVLRTLHFSVLHDTSEEAAKAFSAAIEQTYRSNLKYELSMGIEPVKPKRKLIIYYFAQHPRYSDYSKSIGRGERPQGNPGVFFPDLNRSMFYDFQSQDNFRRAKEQAEAKVKELSDRLRQGKLSPQERQKIGREITQAKGQANAASVQGGDINESVVQHEVTHHILWNTGFHNSRSFTANPMWFVEGTATMFETIAEGMSSNIGAVNKNRLRDFQAMDRVGRLIPLEDLITRRDLFNPATGGEMAPMAYAQAWALTHYLNRTKRGQIKEYVKTVNARPAGYKSTREAELKAFEKAFGKPDRQWVEKWKRWMKRVH